MKNLKNPIFSKLIIMVILALSFSCSTDDNVNEVATAPDVIVPEEEEQEDEEEEEPEIEDADFTPLGTVQIFNADKIDDNYILVNDASNNRVYLMNKQAKLIYEWDLTNNIGNDVFLLPDGNLLASLESDEPKLALGGQGGRLQIIKPDSSLFWDFIYSSDDGETHHDAELLPNGNVLAMVWSRKSEEQALSAGFSLSQDVFPESIIEVDITTNEIVWEWHSWDHLIQDHDTTQNNFGIIKDNPQLIDINYVTKTSEGNDIKGDIMHANAIAYDEELDAIFLSVNFFSEVWVIDHSTTTEQAASNIGGNYNKGGDLIYRFGNPTAYGNPEGVRLFHNNHYVNLLEGDDKGKLLIFSNGNDTSQSTVFELELPEVFDLKQNTNNELKVIWSFTDPDLYSNRVSGAVQLPNSNILITEGDFGYWEVTTEGEVVWRCSIEGFHWRGYHYSKNAPEIELLNLY